MNERVIEALQELVSSQGWTIFKQLVAEQYGDEAVVAQLVNHANNTTDLQRLGTQTAVILSTQAALRVALNLPEQKIAEIEAGGEA